MGKLAHNQSRNLVVLGAMALLVGGCSGSSGTPQDDFAVRPIASFAATDALSRQLFAETVGLNPTRSTQLPVTGTARYTGAVSYVDSNTTFIPKDMKFPEYETFIINNPDYVSRIRMTANFAGDSISGSMDSFRSADNEARRIGITFDGTIVDSKDNTAAFTGTLSGTNEIQTGPTDIKTKNFSGSLAGNFLGGQGDSALGTLAIKRGFTGEERGDVFGVFTAEQ
ncbi:MAG: transferrin-binding protein-like solute binding protein [Rhodobacter sp.]|nr:transferrin-binding protein-like solute binding protein [Rhodobacter sp.]